MATKLSPCLSSFFCQDRHLMLDPDCLKNVAKDKEIKVR